MNRGRIPFNSIYWPNQTTNKNRVGRRNHVKYRKRWISEINHKSYKSTWKITMFEIELPKKKEKKFRCIRINSHLPKKINTIFNCSKSYNRLSDWIKIFIIVYTSRFLNFLSSKYQYSLSFFLSQSRTFPFNYVKNYPNTCESLHSKLNDMFFKPRPDIY